MMSSIRLRNSGRKCRLSSSWTRLLHLVVGQRLVGAGEPERGLLQVGGPEVRGHDDHGVLEVDRATLRVGEPPVLQDLEQRVEHVGVGLLDLVEEHHGERLAAHGLGELAAFVVADVARRRADEARHRVLLHVLRHVELDHRALVTEQELGERLGGLGLADTRRPQEDERSRRALRVLEAGTRTPDRLRHGLDRVVLTDDPLVQLLFHAQELRGLFLGELVDGDAGPQREHLGDRLLVHLVEEVDALGAPLLLLRGALLEQLLLTVAQLGGALELLSLDRGFLLALDLRDLVFELAVVGRGLHPTDTQPRAGLVDEVDRLVGEVTVGDVTVGEVGGRDDRLVGDRHAVVRLVALAQSLQDLDRLRDASAPRP